MQESEFIKNLEKRAREQGWVMETEIMPSWARGVGEWLVVHPWRLVIPISGIAYLVLRIGYGEGIREAILGLFGGFR